MNGSNRSLKTSVLPVSLWVLSLFVGLCLFELTFRLVGCLQGVDYRIFGKQLNLRERTPSKLFYRQTEAALITLRPNTQTVAHTYDYRVVYTTNPWGMRDKPYESTTPAGKHRFLALGDSMTFGEGVPYGSRFSDIAEENLPNIEILNAGVPGYGLGQQWAWMKTLIPAVQPQTVLVFLNFPAIVRRHLPLSIKKGLAKRENPSSISVNLSDYEQVKPLPLFHLSQYFFTSSYLYYLYQAWKLQQRFEGQSSRYWGKWNPARDSHAPDSPVGPWIRKRSEAILSSMVRDCQDLGIQLIAVNIDANWKMNWVRNVRPRVPLLDLSVPLTKFAKKNPLRFKYDRHFNPSSNRFIGEKLTLFLRDYLKSTKGGDNERLSSLSTQ